MSQMSVLVQKEEDVDHISDEYIENVFSVQEGILVRFKTEAVKHAIVSEGDVVVEIGGEGRIRIDEAEINEYFR